MKNLKKSYIQFFYHETFFPKVNSSIGLDENKFNSILKYKDWQYEKEWRLFSNEDYLHLKPSEIYLGVKFDEQNIDIFKDIADEKNCKVYQMKMNYNKYKLEYSEIKL